MTPRLRFARPFSRRFLAEWLAVAVLALAVVTALATTQALRRPDALAYDALLRLARQPTPDDMLIVAIDDRSLAALGRWPWPRRTHAALLRRLAAAHPAAVIYDVLFVEPQADQDGDLAAAIKASGHVYLPLLMTVPGQDGAPFGAAPPVEPIASAAAGVGQVNVHPDPDGIVRRAYLAETDGQTIWPHLIGLVDEALHGPLPLLDRERGGGAAGGVLEGRGEMLIPYLGASGTVRSVSFIDVLNGQAPEAFLRGKTVLVGATAPGLGDRFPSPIGAPSNDMSGVELQANMLEGLAQGRIVRPAAWPAELLFSLAPVAALLAGFLTLRPRANLLLGAALVVAVLAVSAAGLVWARWWLPPGAALAGLALAYPVWGWRRLEASSAYMLEELHRLQLEPGVGPPVPAGLAQGDVVERQLHLMRRAVGQVRDLRRFVGDALEGLPDATFVAAPDGTVLMASAAGRRLLDGLGAPQRAGIDALFARLTPAETDAAPLGLGVAGPVEVCAPNEARYLLDQAPILGHDGADLGWIVRLGDVTALRAAQHRREEILQLLTHDMRSPQASILALLSPAGGQPASGVDAGRIRALAQRTVALADAYVQLSRAEAAPLKLETVDAADLLIEAADALWPQAQAKGVRLAADPAEEQLVQADRGLVLRALVNLIDNAVAHTPAGGTVTCLIRADAQQLAFVIQDQGPGLDAEQKAGLFARFGAGRVGGVGLGLALVKACAQRHGGRVDCESKPGRGARFSLVLPKRLAV